MKKYLFLFVVSLFVITSCIEEIDIPKEEESIKGVLEQLLTDRAECNFESYMRSWVNAPSTFISSSGRDGYTFMKYEDMQNDLKEIFSILSENMEEEGYSVEMELYDFLIKVYEETAWAHCKNKWTKVYSESGETEDAGASFLIFSLEKHDNEWKVAFMSAAAPNLYENI